MLGKLALIFVFAVGVNYAWELAQAPLYVAVDFPTAFVHCFIASLGDGLMVLALYGVVALVARATDWYVRPAPAHYAALAAAGVAIAFAVEWWGLHAAKRWQYSGLMPLIPGTGIGLAPVLQMVLLPPAILGMVRRLTR